MRTLNVTSRTDSISALLEVSRSATRGISFQQRMQAISERLSVLVPSASQSAIVVQLSTPRRPAAELAWFGNGDVESLIEYGARFVHLDPMLPAAKRADGTPQVLSDFVKRRSGWFTEEYLARLAVKHLMGVAHRMPDGSVLLFALHRQRGDRNFCGRDRRLLGAVSADVARGARGPALKARIERLRSGARDGATFLLDRSGNVIYADMSLLGITEPAGTMAEAIGRAGRAFAHSRAREASVRLDVGCSRVHIRFQRFPAGTEAGALAVVSNVDSRWPSTPPKNLGDLTRREREVADLAAQRLPNGEIAERLQVSVDTVKTHLKRVYTKLGVDGRRALARLNAVDGRPTVGFRTSAPRARAADPR